MSKHQDLPAGYRWATEAENDRPDAIVVQRTQDSQGRPYTHDEADLAVPVRTRSPERTEFLTDLLITAVEGGINYWAEVSDYRYEPAAAATVTVYEIENINDDTGEYPADYKPVQVDLNTIASGLSKLLKATADKPAYDQLRLAARTNGQDGDFDAADADQILQCGIFGSSVYS